MIYILGVFFILLGILFDEGTTILIFARGLGIFETNPIAIRYGIIVAYTLSLSFYIGLIFAWGWIIKLYRKFYTQRAAGYKLYDIFIFIFCFFIIFMSGMKIECGYNNIQLLVNSYREDTAPIIEQHAEQQKILKETQPKEFIKSQDINYKEGTIDSINYLQMFFYVIAAYLLMRVGYKVCPYEDAEN